MSDRNGSTDEEWLPISEVARRLNLSERQTRRLVNRLPEGDVQRPAGSPARVRLTALDVRPESGLSPAATPDVRQNSDMNGPESSLHSQNESEACPASVRPESGIASDMSDVESGARSEVPPITAPVLDIPTAALIEELKADVAFLRAQIEAGRVAEAELRRLMLADKNELQALRQKVALLIAPPSAEDKEQSREETPARAWWQRWQMWRKGR